MYFAQGNINIILNDKALTTSIPSVRDSSGTVLVPLNEINEQLGIKVSYDPKKKLVTLIKEEIQVEFVLNSKKIYINNKEKSVVNTGKMIGMKGENILIQ